MPDELTKSKIDELGNRLRSEKDTTEDLKLLNKYIQSFAFAYEAVVQSIRDRLRIEPEVRFSKSRLSIVSKLQRQSIRLSQIQDIAGCRLVVRDIIEQEQMLASVQKLFPHSKVRDLRKRPSHGYRAIHVVVQVSDTPVEKLCERPVEIQIRSMLQDLWAQYCEKLADIFDPTIKYGGGGEEIRQVLDSTFLNCAIVEDTELRFANAADSPAYAHISPIVKRELDRVISIREQIAEDLRKAIHDLNNLPRTDDDLSY